MKTSSTFGNARSLLHSCNHAIFDRLGVSSKAIASENAAAKSRRRQAKANLLPTLWGQSSACKEDRPQERK